MEVPEVDQRSVGSYMPARNVSWTSSILYETEPTSLPYISD